MTLEERIKALLESSQTKKELDEAKFKFAKDGSGEVDTSGDEKDSEDEDQEDQDSEDQTDDEKDGDDQEDDDEKDTDFSKETKKNQIAVKEDASNEMLKAGASKKEAGGKLKEPPNSGDKQDDAGLNAKLKAGFGKKDIPARSVKGFPAAQNTSNSANQVDTQSLPSKPNKVTVGESMSVLFDGEELSEEFKSKAETIFESAVNILVEQRVAELEEEFQAKIEELSEEVSEQVEEAVAQVQNELVENIDGFLDSVVKQWVSDNHVALESGIKVEMVTNFIDGLKTLFTENYIEVPEDKLDVVEEQANQIAELEDALVAINEDNEQLAEGFVELKKSTLIESAAKGLTLKQKEKFASLCEGLEYASDEEYVSKVKTIRESYFKGGEESKGSFEQVTEEVIVPSDMMNKYVTTLSGPLKFSK